jgi:glycosyltransferase involved in cell wall biosynthesis
MAQKRPILAPRTEPIEAVVEDGEQALLFIPLDVESFRSSMRKILESSNLRDYLGKNARRLIEDCHTWQHNARRIFESLDKKFN